MTQVALQPSDPSLLGDRVLVGRTFAGTTTATLIPKAEANCLWLLERMTAELRKAVETGNTEEVRAFIDRLQRNVQTLSYQLHRPAQLVRCQLCPKMVPLEALAHHKSTEHAHATATG
jgi:hypothetical protein